MEHPYEPSDKRSSYLCSSSQAQVEGFALSDDGTGKDLVFDDPYNLPEFMDFDVYSDLCGSSSTPGNKVLPSPGFSSILDDQSLSCTFPDLASPSAGQNTDNLLVPDSFSSTTCYSMANSPSSPTDFDENVTGDFYHSSDALGCDVNTENFVYYSNTDIRNSNLAFDWLVMGEQSVNEDNHCQEDECERKNLSNLPYEKGSRMIFRSVGSSFTEKMLKAMSLFKELSGGEILPQVWAPVKQGDEHVLSTCHQPYLPYQILSGYREVSRTFTFSTIEKPGSFLGLPGRVFVSKRPEWASNVGYYDKEEFLRVNEARDHEVRGTLALPIFELHQQSCCAVLEIVTQKEKANFVTEMENICNALKAVNLRTTEAHVFPRPQNHSKNQRAALVEIGDVLKAVCHTHMLPLALTWLPYRVPEDAIDVKPIIREHSSGRWRTVLCLQDSACFVNDTQMRGFLQACSEHYLEKGQGIAGEALLSNNPFFCPDVKEYHIRDYPLAHHARKFGLHAAVAVKLRSTYTGDDDYILELFLPVNCKGSSEQKLLLDSLAGTIHRLCRSLRTVGNGETVEAGDDKVSIQKGHGKSFSSINNPRRRSQQTTSESELDSRERVPKKGQNRGFFEMETDMVHEQNITGSSIQLERNRFMVEKNISLSVLQKYFSGSLKDAAKAIGVCPTTLKRICRKHGILRWPSRKINKVTRSLKKIQTVIDSVQGVEGSLRYNPITGGLISTSMVQDPEMPNTISPSWNNPSLSNTDSKAKHSRLGCSVSKIEEGQRLAGKIEPVSCSIHGNEVIPSGNSSCSGIVAIEDELDNEVFASGGVEHKQPSSLGVMDFSNCSGSRINCSSSSSQSVKCTRDVSSRITVKATYREDTVRFKLTSSMGCLELFEEVGKRFNLPTGTFQLKYLDDEEEWVMLVSKADLQECLEMLELIGSHTVKLMVRDLPSSAGR